MRYRLNFFSYLHEAESDWALVWEVHWKTDWHRWARAQSCLRPAVEEEVMGALVARQALLALLLALLYPAPEAAASGAGVVTGVSGQVTVSRTAATALPLRFKDEVFLKDRISTAERSLARLLLDQKALVTVRELSELEITEQAGRSTVDLGAGKIAIGVARQRMRSGEIVEIRTQNAVAAIRGTVVIAENIPVPPGAPPQSRIHVLSGYVDITPRDNPGAPPVRMVAPASISIIGQSVGLPVPLNEAARRQLLSDLHQTLPQHLSAMKALAAGEFTRAASLARIITGGGAGGDKALDLREAPSDPSSAPGKAPITPSVQSVGGSASTPPPLFTYTSQTATIPGDLYQVAPHAVQSLSTDLLRATTSALNVGGDVLDVQGGLSSSTPRAFVGLDGSIVSAQTLTRLQQGALSLTGALLDAVNSAITVRGPALVDVQANASLTGLGSAPFVSFTNGLLLLGPGANGFNFASGATAALAGTLLKTSGTVVAGLGDLVSVKAAALSVGTGGPALDFHGATVIGPDLGDVRSNGQLSLGGGFARATGGTLWAPDHFLRITGGGLTSTGAASLFDFTGTTLTAGLLPGGALFEASSSAAVSDTTGHALLHVDGGSLRLSGGTKGFLATSQGTVNFDGGLLDAVNTAITSSDDLVLGSGRGRFIQTDPAAPQTGPAVPLVSVTGGTHHIATAGSIFHLVGTASALDLVSGLVVGTEKPVQPGGTLLDLAGAAVTSGRAVTVDVALLQASAPLLTLRADALGNGASLTTSGNTLELTSKAKLDSTATLFSLDRSQLTVNNAALAAVAKGSYLRTAGDFASLANGSTLTINNGVLLFATGGSIVNIRGALIAFSGTPGNTVTVSNTLAFVNIGGIPVALTGGALRGNVLITTGTAIKNPALGTITPYKALIQVDGVTTKVTISGN